ncbi:MAG: AAA domain-containing protein [Myxococcales bacterium]|nr:AAA domain-containing protein [Myxococcota bacterium]MDW8281546.1 AAA domain-containing protein [Myxococcales bacterium]
MRVCDVIHGQIENIELKRSDGDLFPEHLVSHMELFLRQVDSGDLLLQMGADAWPIVGASPQDQDSLRKLMARNLPRLIWSVQVRPSQGPREFVHVQVHEFPSTLVWNEPLDLGVGDTLVDDLRRRRPQLGSVEALVRWLTETILLPPAAAGEHPRALLSGSPSSNGRKKTAFRLYGKGFAVDVEQDANGRLQATRLVPARQAVRGDERRPIYLARGPFQFCDATLAGQFRGVAKTELDLLVAQASSYLGLWKEYNKRERQAILRRARNFRWLSYRRCKPLANGAWRFELTGNPTPDDWQRLTELEGEQLEAAEEVPAAIGDFQGSTPSEETTQDWNRVDNAFVGDVVGWQQQPPCLDLQPLPEHDARTPAEQGFLFVALGGDKTRHERREHAWQSIRDCTNPMPQLGLIIEGRPVPERHGRRLEPLTRAVRELLPHPTPRQRLALEVALNTPDIALIQGPPGTGKTRVIAALQARLAEEDEGGSPYGPYQSVLLTSFQHDAVEHAAAATRVLGLPAIKVGARRGAEESHDAIDIWRTETAHRVRAARARLGAESTIHAALRDVRDLTVAYLRATSRNDEPAKVLQQAAERARPWLPASILDEIAALSTRLSRVGALSLQDEERALALGAVRSLRTEAIPFADDGPACAYKALRRLAELPGFELSPEESTVLQEAARWMPSAPVSHELLARLQRVRNSLLDRLQPRAEVGRSPRTHADVEDMLVRIIDALIRRAKETPAGIEMAVEQWLHALEHDPQGIRQVVQDHSVVLAATCQQSVSRAMTNLKESTDVVFRSVIVDEAARANPLDLLIPMSLAERRIVLVGDHRQLPHILEPDVEREIEQSVQKETREQLRCSLFYKLFTELREREKKDGIQRTVTLDVQYRMHPELGRFVSEQFYEPYGEGFASGRPAEDFAHQVRLANGTSLTGKVAAWIDVPRERGLEKGRRSKSRPAEARRIAKEAKAIVEQCADLSVGVITFYAAQRDAILTEMAELGLVENGNQGEARICARICDRWQRTRDGRERLRVGTVDAFQGMEFDVVLLSLTRCNDVVVRDEVTRRRRYGFLLLENRLCVAMSRQQRLLVVVGDAGMVTGPDAESSIPSLVAFWRLCGGPYGQIIRS